MRPVVIAFAAFIAAAPAVSAQQAADQPAAQPEAATTESVTSTATPAAVQAPADGLSDLPVVQPSFETSEARDSGQAVDNRTRNILAVVGAVVIVVALLSFIS